MNFHFIVIWSRSGVLVNALDGRNPAIVRRVLDAGVPLTVPNQPRESMLAVAIEGCNQAKDFSHLAEILTMLLQAGADPNHGGRNGGPMLFTAGLPPEAVKPLLAGGADIEARERGETPLMAHAYSEPLVRELPADGADPAVKEPNGKTALSIAREKQCESCVDLIQAAIEKKNAAAH